MSEGRSAQATVVEVSAGGNLAAWVRHHRSVAADSLGRLLAAWLNSLLTWLVIGIALALPAMMYVLLGNVSSVSAGFGGKPRITLFLLDSTRAVGEAMLAEISAEPAVATARYISAADALADFEQRSEFKGVLETLEHNPLPGRQRPGRSRLGTAPTAAGGACREHCQLDGAFLRDGRLSNHR